MATIDACVCDIPMDQLETAEAFALESLQMDKERVMKRYAETYDETLKRCNDEVKCRGMYDCFTIEANDGEEIRLEGGVVLKSKVLAEALSLADEVVAYIVTLNGHDELLENPDNSMLEGMFYNAWGSGFSMSGHRWFKKAIQEKVLACGRYPGRGWYPGEDGVEIGLQNELFELIDPSKIGVTLSGTAMRPVMSVNGFIGIGNDPAIQEVGL